MTRINLNNSRDRRMKPIDNVINDSKKGEEEESPWMIETQHSTQSFLTLRIPLHFRLEKQTCRKHTQSINTSLDLHAVNTDRHNNNNNNNNQDDHIRMLILHWNTVAVYTGVFPRVQVRLLLLQQYIYTYFQLERTQKTMFLLWARLDFLFIVTKFLGVRCRLISQLINIDLLDFVA